MQGTPPTSQKPARAWPNPVRLYVQRSFAETNAISGIEKAEVEMKLKSVITAAAESDTLEKVDWDNLSLPQQMIQAERAEAALRSSAPPLMPSTAVKIQDTNHSSHEFSKKRKSSDLDASSPIETGQPPWRAKVENGSLESRMPAWSNKRAKNGVIPASASKSQYNAEKEQRKRRFNLESNGVAWSSNGGISPATPDIQEAMTGPVIGRSQTLEKKYFRLTSAPNPDNVRPLPVLEKTLDLLKRKWRQENNYGYICDQFKSLRQDLTVQHIKTDFTVNVYEIHARIALEKGDLGEYNQCQTQLRALYSQNLGGHPTEFKAYRILYFLHTCNRTDMNDVLADLTPTEKKDPAIKHALNARSSLALGNYHRFFKLYLETPNMGAYLMDMFVSRERLAALANICRA